MSGYDSESVTKGGVSTSSGSSWSWTRSGTVWDDGRNNWSEGWSKSSWKDGKYAPGESESKTGGFDPKKTGPQVNDVPKFGEAPRLNKGPKQQVPPDLVKQPKPSDDIWRLPSVIFKEPLFKDIDLNKPPKRKPSKDYFEPIADKPDIADNFSGDLFAGGAPAKPTFKEKIEKLLKSGAVANYSKIFALIFNSSQAERRTVTQDPKMMRLIRDSFSSQPQLATPIAASLLTGEQRWSNPSNSFTEHFQRNTEKALSYDATMNCWEMILYAAFLCGQISGSQIKKFLDSTYPTGRQMATMGFSNDLPFYPWRGENASSKTKYPQPGDLVYFRDWTSFPGHVAISLYGSLVVSLWTKPDFGNGNRNRIQIIDINDLPGQVLIGPPLTEAIKAGKI